MFVSRVSLLRENVADLQRRLDKSEAEKLDLLNRLLERRNIEPIGAREPQVQPSVIQVLSPFGAVPLEMEEPLKESAIQEETQYLMDTQGLQPDIARQHAERWFVEYNKALT